MARKQATIFGACAGALSSLAYMLYQDGLYEGAGFLAVLFGLVGVMPVIQTWRETGLLLATMAQTMIAGLCLAVGVLVLTRSFSDTSQGTLMILAILGVAGPVLRPA